MKDRPSLDSFVEATKTSLANRKPSDLTKSRAKLHPERPPVPSLDRLQAYSDYYEVNQSRNQEDKSLPSKSSAGLATVATSPSHNRYGNNMARGVPWQTQAEFLQRMRKVESSETTVLARPTKKRSLQAVRESLEKVEKQYKRDRRFRKTSNTVGKTINAKWQNI